MKSHIWTICFCTFLSIETKKSWEHKLLTTFNESISPKNIFIEISKIFKKSLKRFHTFRIKLIHFWVSNKKLFQENDELAVSLLSIPIETSESSEFSHYVIAYKRNDPNDKNTRLIDGLMMSAKIKTDLPLHEGLTVQKKKKSCGFLTNSFSMM